MATPSSASGRYSPSFFRSPSTVFETAALGRLPPSVSPLPVQPRGFPFAASVPPTRVFRPRGLAPPRRLAPHKVRGPIASRFRSWGSLGFPVPRPFDRSRRGLTGRVPPMQFIPFEERHSPVAVPCHHGRFPLVVHAGSCSTSSSLPCGRRGFRPSLTTPLLPAGPLTTTPSARSTPRRCSTRPAEASQRRCPRAPAQ